MLHTYIDKLVAVSINAPFTNNSLDLCTYDFVSSIVILFVAIYYINYRFFNTQRRNKNRRQSMRIFLLQGNVIRSAYNAGGYNDDQRENHLIPTLLSAAIGRGIFNPRGLAT